MKKLIFCASAIILIACNGGKSGLATSQNDSLSTDVIHSEQIVESEQSEDFTEDGPDEIEVETPEEANVIVWTAIGGVQPIQATKKKGAVRAVTCTAYVRIEKQNDFAQIRLITETYIDDKVTPDKRKEQLFTGEWKIRRNLQGKQMKDGYFLDLHGDGGELRAFAFKELQSMSVSGYNDIFEIREVSYLKSTIDE